MVGDEPEHTNKAAQTIIYWHLIYVKSLPREWTIYQTIINLKIIFSKNIARRVPESTTYPTGIPVVYTFPVASESHGESIEQSNIFADRLARAAYTAAIYDFIWVDMGFFCSVLKTKKKNKKKY